MEGDSDQRRAPWLLSPVPGFRPVPRQRGDGCHLRAPVPPLAQGYAVRRGPLADRRRRVRRLRPPARQGLLAPLNLAPPSRAPSRRAFFRHAPVPPPAPC